MPLPSVRPCSILRRRQKLSSFSVMSRKAERYINPLSGGGRTFCTTQIGNYAMRQINGRVACCLHSRRHERAVNRGLPEVRGE